jgi:two-component system NarL family response regulator
MPPQQTSGHLPLDLKDSMSHSHCIKVRIVHHDPVAEAGLAAAFSRYPDLEVQQSSATRDEAKCHAQLSCAEQADVFVTDYAQGVKLASEAAGVARSGAMPKILIVGGSAGEWEIRSAMEMGVRGYVLLGCALDELAASVRAVHRGGRHLSPEAAARLAESFSVEPLTVREEEVLCLVVDGLCNKAIGRQLGIAVGTVKSHLKSAFEKLGVGSRTQAAAVVARRGLMRTRARGTASIQ